MITSRMTGSRFRTALLASVLLLALGVIGWRMVTLYRTPRVYAPYATPMRIFLASAAAVDSFALRAAGASDNAIAWAIREARRDPRIARDLSRGLGVVSGRRAGDSAVVLFRGTTGVCQGRNLLATFLDRPPRSRVVKVSTECGTP